MMFQLKNKMAREEFLKIAKQAPNPSYVMDEVALVENMKVLQSVEKNSGVNILCALKGFAMWSMFPIMRNYISGATASSLNEAKLCFEEFGKKAHCCFVVYLEEEFEEVLKIASHITFNSLSQYNKFKKYIALNPEIKFAIRLNPQFSQVGVEKYNPCMPGSRFGVTPDLFPEVLPEGITGIHVHALCESSSEELANLVDFMDEKFGHLFHQCEWVNLGGGHHITKEGYDTELLEQTLANFKQNYNLKELMIEPGEAMGWRAGVLLSRIEDVVYSGNQKIYMLNVSFSAHMPDCLEMPYQPAVVGEDDKNPEVVLGGNTCMSGDFLDGFKLPNNLKEGDDVIFEDMMHYTFVKTTTFNGVPQPGLASVTLKGELKIIKEFSYEDFKNRLS